VLVAYLSELLELYAGVPRAELLPADLTAEVNRAARTAGWLPEPMRRYVLDRLLRGVFRKP
jgi:hypothetical protein